MKTNDRRRACRIHLFLVLPALLCAPLVSNGEPDDGLGSPFGFHPAIPLEAAVDIGVRWDRGPGPYILWPQVQPDLSKPAYDFKSIVDQRKKKQLNYDRDFTAHPPTIRILANIEPTPLRLHKGAWAPIDADAYRAFVIATVERYDGDDDIGNRVAPPDCYVPGDNMYPDAATIAALRANPVKFWQVSNEPTLEQKLDARTYPAFQAMTYRAIKEADPEATVLIGGSTGFPDNYIEIFDREFVPILQGLAGRYVDIFDLHWYGYARGDYRFTDGRSGQDVLEHVRRRLVQTGFPADMPIWITEMGSPSGDTLKRKQPKHRKAVEPADERMQAVDYVKRYIYSVAHGVDKVFICLGIKEVVYEHPAGYFSKTQLIYDGQGENEPPDGTKKLSYYTYKLMTSRLGGSDWSAIEAVREADAVYVYRLPRKGGGSAWVAWWDSFESPGADTRSVTLELGRGGEVTVTEMVPDAPVGGQLDEDGFPGFFKSSRMRGDGGRLTLTLGDSPVIIEPAD